MITLSPEAGQVVKEIQKQENLPANAALRLGVTNEGCGESATQFRYVLDFDVNPAKADDQVFESEGVKIYVNKESAPHLEGLVLDAQQDAIGSVQFMFKNPKAKHNCGCGHTFSEDQPPQH